MDTLALIGMLAGCGWAGAGLVGFAAVAWKPGAVVAVACAVWLVAHGGVSPEVIEACAVGVLLLLVFARQWLVPMRREDRRPDEPGA